MPPALLNLPAEIHTEIASFLPGRDVKNLRLVCIKALERFPLKFSRIFLSPNKADIRVFHKVSRHKALRHQVVELVWDHTYFPELFPKSRGEIGSELSGLQLPDHMKQPDRYELDYDYSTNFSEPRCDTLSICKCMEIYDTLARGQTKNIKSKKDLRALAYYIHRFPRLKKITICHATQGWLFEPFYDTPTTRLLPQGFRYRINRCHTMRPYNEVAWSRIKREYPEYSRGYIGILNVLSLVGNSLEIEELSIQSNGLRHGLIAHFFNQATPEYHDFVAMLNRPTFRRLDLVLTTKSQNRIHWPAFRSGHLRHALGQAVNIQHFSLTADMHTVELSEDNWTALGQIIPADIWPLLRDFRLMDFLVKQDDLVTFLGTLPLNIRTIELGQLHFVDGHGDYATLLDSIKHELHWSDRQVAKQSRLTIIVTISELCSTWHEELDRF
ncbi:hypothetical protein V2G26_003075 [Clonostachys chloroleuca]